MVHKINSDNHDLDHMMMSKINIKCNDKVHVISKMDVLENEIDPENVEQPTNGSSHHIN